MAAPIYYRWDDDNAPIARGERESLSEILTACLVDGYGTKPAAGWTKEYENAAKTISAFRNNPATGTGFYLQVDGERYSQAGTFYITGFETMSSESVGLGNFSDTYDHYFSTAVMGTIARPWVLIADDRFFWLIVWETLTDAPLKASKSDSGIIFGDLVAWDLTDEYNCCIGGSNSLGIPVGIKPPATTLTAPSAYYISMPRRESGVYDPKGYCMVRGGGPTSDTAMGVVGIEYTPGDPLLYTRPWVNSENLYHIRGYMPGMYYPCHPQPFDQLEEVAVDGHGNMLSLCTLECSNGASNMLISLEDWRA